MINFLRSSESVLDARQDSRPDWCIKLASLYYKGDGITQDYALAFQWYLKAASHPPSAPSFKFQIPSIIFARRLIAYMYQQGQGVTQSLDNAITWYKAASDLGDGNSDSQLGKLYYDQGDYLNALKWYTLGASRGDSIAAHNLSGMYYSGQGIPRNYIEAYKWMSISVALDTIENQQSKSELNRIESHLNKTNVAKAQSLAEKYYATLQQTNQ